MLAYMAANDGSRLANIFGSSLASSLGSIEAKLAMALGSIPKPAIILGSMPNILGSKAAAAAAAEAAAAEVAPPEEDFGSTSFGSIPISIRTFGSSPANILGSRPNIFGSRSMLGGLAAEAEEEDFSELL